VVWKVPKNKQEIRGYIENEEDVTTIAIPATLSSGLLALEFEALLIYVRI